MTDAVRSPQQIRDEFQARRDTIVNEMGSAERIDRQHARGRLTIRERLDRLFDEGSFREIGTFAVSEVPNVRDRTPGDGKIGGLGGDQRAPRRRVRRRRDGAARLLVRWSAASG